MRRSTLNAQHPRKWALALRREMQVAIGQQLRVECELPKELPPKLKVLLPRSYGEHDPYADVVGTCQPAAQKSVTRTAPTHLI